MHLFKLIFSLSLDKYPEMELLDHMVVLFLVFMRNLSYCFLQWLHQFTFPSTVYKGSLFSTSSPTVQFFCFVLFVCLFGCAMRHVGSQFSSQRSNPHSLPWKHGVLTHGPPGKSQNSVLSVQFCHETKTALKISLFSFFFF